MQQKTDDNSEFFCERNGRVNGRTQKLTTDKPRPARANSIFWRRKSSFIKQDIIKPIPAQREVNIPAIIAALFDWNTYFQRFF